MQVTVVLLYTRLLMGDGLQVKPTPLVDINGRRNPLSNKHLITVAGHTIIEKGSNVSFM